MPIKNLVRLRAPRVSQPESLAQQKLKAHHPKKAAKSWFYRTIQQLKKFNVWLTSFRANLGAKIPGVQIRTRNIVTKNIDNFMTGKGIKAESKTGVLLDSEEMEFANTVMGTGATFDGKKLMALDKSTMKEIEEDFDDVTARYTKELIACDRKSDTGSLKESDVQRLETLGVEFQEKRHRFTAATHLAIKLDLDRMNEKLRSPSEMQQLIKAQARAEAFNPEDFEDSMLVARFNVASFDSAQRDIDRRIVGLIEEFRGEVYEDVAPFLDAEDGDFAKLVDEQKRHYLIKGTRTLGTTTSGVRLPGLDWYVKKAKADYKDHAEFEDMDLVQKAAAMMLKDWSSFHSQIEAKQGAIRQDREDGTGQFNPDKMDSYLYGQSYMATLKWLEELALTEKAGDPNKPPRINKAAIRDLTTDYGDDLGFGLRVDEAATNEAVLKKIRYEFL